MAVKRHWTSGKPRSVGIPSAFVQEILNYIDWCVENPIMKVEVATFQGEITHAEVPHPRPMTKVGLAAYMGVSIKTIHEAIRDPNYHEIVDPALQIMASHNLEYATIGEYNAVLVSKIEGLRDTTDIISSDGSMSPAKKTDLSKLSTDDLMKLEEIMKRAESE